MYHKISPKNIYLHKYLLWSYCERKHCGRCTDTSIVESQVYTPVFSMVADFFRFNIRSIIGSEVRKSQQFKYYSACAIHMYVSNFKKKTMTCEDYNKNKVALNATRI